MAVVFILVANTPPVNVEVAKPETVKVVPTFSAPVVVALLEVEFNAVKFNKVVEPESRRFESEVSPAVAVKVPVKFEALDMV